jgi:formylglycine-generating enzyme required for sulfatase activity
MERELIDVGVEVDCPQRRSGKKVARGPDGRLYPWGNTVDGLWTNFCDRNCIGSWTNPDYDDGYATSAPVGSYPEGKSPYGVYNRAGNVWEWVEDRYASDYYKNSPPENPVGPSWGEEHVVRGGHGTTWVAPLVLLFRPRLLPRIQTIG